MRPDKLPQAIQQYVHQEMGQEFLNPPIFDIEQSFLDCALRISYGCVYFKFES